MPTFNVGTISGTLELDRSPFNRDLDAAKADAAEFSRKHITATVDLDAKDAGKQLSSLNRQMTTLGKKTARPVVNPDTKAGSTQLDLMQAKLDKLSKATARPDVTLAGTTVTDARIKLLQRQLQQINRTKATATVDVDTKKSEQGITRLLDGVLALAPALVPVTAAAAGGGAAIGTAFLAAGVGVGAFALAAAPAIKKVSDAAGALTTDVNQQTAAQKKSLAELTTSEKAAARDLVSLSQTYAGFQKVLEPTVFRDAAAAYGLAETGLHRLAPVAHTTGQALGGLERDAQKALDSRFYRSFFDYIGVEAPRAVTVFGHAAGNIATGAVGVLQQFTPIEHQFEAGLDRLTGKWAAFGQNAARSQGLQSFIEYVQREGPQAIHLLGQFATTFATVAKDAAPLGAAELKIVTETLQLVDAAAKAHPELIQVALALYTINKATAALKLTSLATGVGGMAKNTAGAVTGIVGLATKSKTLEQAFPRVSGVVGKFTTATTGARVGALDLGEAMGAGEIAGYGLAGGLTAVVGGLVAAQAYFSRNKQTIDQETASIIANDKATGNNLAGYEKAQRQIAAIEKQAADARRKALANAGGASDPTGAGFAAQANNAAQAQAALTKLTTAQRNVVQGAAGIQQEFHQIGPQYTLTTKQALTLADTLGIDLSKGWRGNSQQAEANRAKMAEYVAQVKLSHDPSAQFKKDIDNAANSSQDAATQITNMNNALNSYATLVSGITTTSAQAGDALAALAKDFTANTGAASRNAAAQRILTGNLLTAGPQTRKLAEDLASLQSGFNQNLEAMFQTAVQSGHTAQGFQNVAKQAAANRAALIRQLEAMGLNAAEAKALADRYAAIPKDITTKAHLANVQQTEADAAGIKKKIDDIPTAHTTKALAQVKDAETDIASLKERIKGLPATAKTKAEAEVATAERKLRDLLANINALTHGNKPWTVHINADGTFHQPLTDKGASRGVHSTFATGGFTGTIGRKGVDSIPALLAPHEYVNQASSVDREGVAAFDALNAGRATIVPRFAVGGLVDINAAANVAALNAGASSFVNSSIARYLKYFNAQESKLTVPIGGSSGSGVRGNAAANRAIAMSLMPLFGWNSAAQWMAFDALEMSEAGYNNLAQNPISSAFGQGQFLDSTWGRYGRKTSDPTSQLLYMDEYIRDDYGDPITAWAFHRLHNYYAKGGNPSPGSWGVVGEAGPELVHFRGPATVYSNAQSRAMGMGTVPGYAGGGQVPARAPQLVQFTSGGSRASAGLSPAAITAIVRAVVSAMPSRQAPVIGHADFHDNTDVELTLRKAAFVMQTSGLL